MGGRGNHEAGAGIAAEADGILAPPPRKRALDAMALLCAEKGYRATSLTQVRERAGLSEAEMSKLFKTKEECGVAAVDAILAEVMSTVSANYGADRPERDSVLIAIKSILELLAAHPAYTSLSFICARQMSPSRLGEGYETGTRMLSAMLERLGEEGGGEPLPPRAARGALGGAEAVVRREIIAGRTEDLPRLLPDFIYAATVAPLGQEEALRLANRGRELLAGR